MRIKAFAKINLTLDITGKRKNGYHLIDSVMQSISLYDTVIVKKASEIVVGCSTKALFGKNNIAYNSAEEFFRASEINGGADIYIEKSIPTAAGLGGGSADAAAVLFGLNAIYETGFSVEELCRIGLKVGADIPFCITGGTARVEGIGEIIRRVPDMPECGIVVIKVGEKASTAEMYRKIDVKGDFSNDTPKVLAAIENHNLSLLCQNIGNAFSSVSDTEIPFELLKKTRPIGYSLSGSGPACFGIYSDFKKAEEAALFLRNNGVEAFAVKTEKNGIVIE